MDEHIYYLINKCKNRNKKYHKIADKRKVEFWNSIANKINKRYETIYTKYQC